MRDALREECPGTGDYAASQVHTGRSVACGAPVHDHGSPARAHDRRQLTSEASWRGDGLRADRADASLERLRACDTPGVRFGMRLQDTWQPQVDDRARGQITQACFPGSDLDALLEQAILVLDGRLMDADGQIGPGNERVPGRLVGLQPPKGYGVFLTHLPPRIGPRQVADLYRGRGEVALRLRVDTSVNRLDAIDAARPCSLKTLLQASRMASTIAALLAHIHHGRTRPQQPGTPRTQAPRHPRRLALQLAVACQAIAQACERQGAEATQRWHKIAEWRTQSGRAPTWRRRPSV